MKERCDYLKSTVDNYLTSELKNLKDMHANLDLELTNIQSNADLMEKHMADDTKWDDNELMDCKVSVVLPLSSSMGTGIPPTVFSPLFDLHFMGKTGRRNGTQLNLMQLEILDR